MMISNFLRPLALLLLALWSVPVAAQTASELVEQGCDFEAEGECEKAIAAFTKAISLDPKYDLAYIERGRTYWIMEKHDMAIADLTRAIACQPSVEAYDLRACVYADQGKCDLALADQDKLIAMEPAVAGHWHSRAMTLKAMKRYDRAIADYSKALELKPRFSVVYVGRATVHRAQGNYDKALADLAKALEISPGYAWARIEQGYTFMLLKQYDKALADFSKVLADSKHPTAMLYRGITLIHLGRNDEALAAYNDMLAAHPRCFITLYYRGLLYRQLGKHEAAVADFTAVLRSDAAYTPAYRERAACNLALGQTAAAEQDRKKADELAADGGRRQSPLVTATEPIYPY